MITIFTPIYNRAYIVENLYYSLLRQTCYDFEWLLIDDGSTDDIASLVYQWIENTQKFKIRLYSQENRGKHCAINYGVKLAKYEIFFIVDSDDYLEDDAVETILKYWNGIRANRQFAGVSGLRRNRSRAVIGGIPNFEEFIDATNLERKEFGLEGDKAEVFKTDILRKYPFPEYENEKFLTEAVIWDRIAYEGYKIRWINKSLVICEYLEDGLTSKGQQLFLENPKGWAHLLRGEVKYRAVKKTDYLKKCYYYYECENISFSDGEIKDNLGLSDSELKYIIEQYSQFEQKLSDICCDRKVCIYAYGQWGKRLKGYLDRLNIQVEYVIDKRHEEIKELSAYSIEATLPKVDIVFIALEKNAEQLKINVRSKASEAGIILLKDIKPVIW